MNTAIVDSRGRHQRVWGILAAFGLVLVSQGNMALGQTSGTWTSTTDGLWSESANWSGGAIASGAGATASFTSDITAATTIGLDSSRTIGNLTFNDTVSPTFTTPWLLGNNGDIGNILTLDVASGTPTITVGTSNRADISATLAGTKGLVKAGAGRLVLTGSNSYSGTTTLAAESGVLVLGHANALGGSTVVNITGNTSGVSVGNGVSTGAGATITLSGGANGNNNDGGLTALNSSGTWAGNVTLTSGRLGYREGNLVITGTVGGGNFVLSGWGDGKENTGSQYGVTLAGPSTYTGSTGLLRGWLRLGRDDALPTGTTLDVFTTANNTGASQAATFDLNGFNQTVAVLQSTGLRSRDGYANGYVTNTSLTSGTLTVNQATSGTYRGLLTGNVSLVKGGAGNLTLGPIFVTTGNSFVNGTNSFTGTTRVDGGTLTLSSGTTTTSLALFGSTFDTDGAGTLAIESGITAATFGGLTGSGTFGLQTTAAGAVALSVGGGNASSTFAGRLTGAGSLVKIGSGTLTLTGASSDYAGGTTVSAGTLLVTNTAAIPGLLSSGSYTVAAGATLATGTAFADATLEAMLGTGNFAANSVLGVDTAAGDRTFASSLSGTIGLSVTGGNRLTLSGSNRLGAIAVTNATLTVSDTAGLLGSGAITVDGGTIEWNPGGNRSYSFNGRTFTVTDSGATFRGVDAGNLTFGNLSGTGAVIFESGSGTLVTNSNTYSGGTTIKPGATVAYTANDGFGSGPLTIEGGRLRSTTSGSRTIGNDTTLAGDVDFFSLSSGNDRDLVFTGPMTIAGESRTVTVNMSPAAGSTGIFFNGPIDDDGAGLGLVKTGTSMLILGGANTYSGTTTLAAGTLRLDNADALAGGGDLSFTGGVLRYTATNTADYAARIRGSTGAIGINTNGETVTWAGVVDSSNIGGLVKTGSGTLVLGGNNAYTGATTVSGGTLQIGAGGTSGSITGDVALSNSSGLVFDRSDDLTYAGAISGPGSFTKLGAGTLTLSGSNSYTQTTTVAGGTLVIATTTALPAATFTLDGGTIVNATGATNFGRSGGMGAISIGPAGGVLRSDARLDMLGVISGTSPTASLRYGRASGNGSALLVISATNTYEGGTVIEGGLSVVVDNNSAFGTGTLDLAGARIRSRAGLPRTLANAVTISADTQFNAAAGDPNLTFTGPVTLSGGDRTLQVDSVQSSGDSGVIFTNVIGDDGNMYGITKTGAGVLAFEGANTYTGPTTVSAGTLLVNGDQSAATGAVSVASGATLGGSGVIGGAVSILGGGIVAPGTSPGTLTVNNAFSLADTSILSYEFDAQNTTIGGGVNDLVTGVTNLTLDGILNVTGSGDWTNVATNTAWRLFDYTGSLVDNGLSLGSLPTLAAGQFFQVDTATTGQVNLVVVPEPDSFILLALGAGIVAWSRRRR